MKKLIMMAMICFIVTFTSCVITIPTQATLSDQTLLLAQNKDIKVNYTLKSDISDGFIPYVTEMKNGSETIYDESYKYNSQTAFKKIWESYFINKFNQYSTNEMNVQITLKKLNLRQQSATSVGMTMLTGNVKVNVAAISVIHIVIDFKGKKYEKQFECVTSDYNESQQMRRGSYSYTANQTNPTQQKAKLLENCLNKSVIQFENYVRSILFTK